MNATNLARVQAIWAEVLDRPVTPEDNVFDLGASSLHVVQAAVRINNALGIAVEPQLLFDHPTPSQLSASIELALALTGAVDREAGDGLEEGTL
jgi:acyl carrier protein